MIKVVCETNIWETLIQNRVFQTFNAHQSHVEGCLNHRLLVPMPRISGVSPRICISNKFPGIAKVWGPHFENHSSKQRSTSFFLNGQTANISNSPAIDVSCRYSTLLFQGKAIKDSRYTNGHDCIHIQPYLQKADGP